MHKSELSDLVCGKRHTAESCQAKTSAEVVRDREMSHPMRDQERTQKVGLQGLPTGAGPLKQEGRKVVSGSSVLRYSCTVVQKTQTTCGPSPGRRLRFAFLLTECPTPPSSYLFSSSSHRKLENNFSRKLIKESLF